MTIDMVAVTNLDKTPEKFAELVWLVSETTGLPLVVRSENPEALVEAATAIRSEILWPTSKWGGDDNNVEKRAASDMIVRSTDGKPGNHHRRSEKYRW